MMAGGRTGRGVVSGLLADRWTASSLISISQISSKNMSTVSFLLPLYLLAPWVFGRRGLGPGPGRPWGATAGAERRGRGG